MFGIAKWLVKWLVRIAILVAVIGGLLHIGILDVAAQETTTPTDERANETQTTKYVFSDSVRLISYEKGPNGNVIAIIESDRSGVDGSWADGSVNSEGPLPPLQEINLHEGRNEVVLETENCPVGVITIDGSRYRMDACQDVQATPEQNLTIQSVVLTGGFIFGFIAVSAAAFRQIRKNKVEDKF